ncbi:hypothetical protein Poli38472_009786 [Pythium oligandrum]|uniref:TAFII55 protein conserved region domain-containing protein n=1 Tax=Pythium oligandrum TaxID=41045 RepID=A0A8K1FL35_PYTOL|nr:hypothetical protein Poli38472_009786 [Pythium oligandrum]|eukprot:TMW62293.1 hypothetical protein Poli38472_009786 [Pythium oligandrum]
MEQFLLQLPKRLAQEVRAAIANGDNSKVEMIAGADNKHFSFVVNGKQYSAKIAHLPTILETHKTYDDNFLYKSGEIGQIFIVTDKEDEKKQLEEIEELQNGITPPNTNVVKRKYEKTKWNKPFPKTEVARVEEDLVRMLQSGPYEEVQEELVDFCDWMVDEDHPNGITVTDELELIRQHPEYLELTAESPAKQPKLDRSGRGNDYSAVNTPIATDIGSEVESHGGQESAQRSPAFAPTPSPGMSPTDADAEEKEVDDLENDLLDGMDEKPTSPQVNKKSYLEDPAYLQLVTARDRLQKAVRDADRDVNDFAAKMNTNSNFVVKNRFKQMMETSQKQRDEAAAELEKVQSQMRDMENS